LDQDIIDYLIEIGALEFVHVDETGNNVYRFTELAKKLVPEIYYAHMKEFNNIVFSLWNKNLIDVVFDDEGEPLISINENSFDSEKIKELDEEEADGLKEIIISWNERSKE
jgi:hypothetical protein